MLLHLKHSSWLPLAFILFSCSGITPAFFSVEPSTSPDYSMYTELLQRHVAEDGTVNYEALVDDHEELMEVTRLLSANSPAQNWSKEEQLAFWINAYNAFTLQLIVDHYPVESITKIKRIHLPLISTIWGKKFFKIGGTKMSLGQIEHKILREQFNEPRIHFAINCASFSCPKLRNEAFEAEYLEEQLEDQTRYFVNNPDKNSMEADDIELSRIFLWFKADFTKESSLIDFLNRF